MTIILCWRSKDFMFLAGDSRVVEGNTALPIKVRKIFPIGDNLLLGGAGSVGSIQQLSKLALRNVQISKVVLDIDPSVISPLELSDELANLNFQLPLEHRHFNPFGFLVCGYNPFLQTFEAYSVSDDGSTLPIEDYFALGSGSHLAYSLLEEHFNEGLSKEEVSGLLIWIIQEVSKRDLSVSSVEPLVYCVESNKIQRWDLPREPKPETTETKKEKRLRQEAQESP